MFYGFIKLFKKFFDIVIIFLVLKNIFERIEKFLKFEIYRVYYMKKTLQIVLVGWEMDRLMHGLKKFPPRKVIFITSSAKKSFKKKWAYITDDVVNKAISQVGSLIETETVKVNYHDFDDCISTMIKVLEENVSSYDEILLNVSSASKPLVIASVLASQYYPVKLFYVIPEDYHSKDKLLSTGAKDIIELPTFELKSLVFPVKKQREIFNELSYDKISFSNLIKKYALRHKIKLDDLKIKKMKSLFFYHLKNLRQKRLIDLKTENRELFISLTNTGKFIYKIVECRGK